MSANAGSQGTDSMYVGIMEKWKDIFHGHLLQVCILISGSAQALWCSLYTTHSLPLKVTAGLSLQALFL